MVGEYATTVGIALLLTFKLTEKSQPPAPAKLGILVKYPIKLLVPTATPAE